MNTTLPPFVLVSALLLAAMAGQDPPPSAPPAPAPAPASGSTWSEGFGRATNYRSALANAIEDAVAKVKGISVARGPAVRSRLSVVSNTRPAPRTVGATVSPTRSANGCSNRSPAS
jgi:hypothetical protein